MLKNIQQAYALYPGWKVIVYYDLSVPDAVIKSVEQLGASTVEVMDESYGMFWRFFAADLPDCRYVIFRDADSRLSLRENAAVQAWIKSGKAIHIMRDHPYHRIPFGADSMGILGGMWGIKGSLVEMKNLIKSFSKNHDLTYGSDQKFLQQIASMFSTNATVHDEFFSAKPFPVARVGYEFVGERIDENEIPIGNDREVIKDFHDKSPVIKNKGSIIQSIKGLFNFKVFQ